jgi:hypothetical protein
MQSYSRAKALVGKGETALVLFTRGHNFRIGRNRRRGSTGNWNLNAKRAEKADWILVYLKGERGGALWRARLAALTPGARPRKKRSKGWRVKLSDLRLVGHTNKDWPQFAGMAKGARREVRYVAR